MNLPTWITLSRLLGAPLVLALLADPTPVHRWWAGGLFLLAAGTDWVDGYLARRLNQVTDLGKFLDPLVDKLLVLAPLLALVGMGRVPAWGVFLVLARELTIAGWRVNPAFQSQAVPGANRWGKAKTVVQIVAVTLLLLPLTGPWPGIAIACFWLAVAITWISGVLYLRPWGVRGGWVDG
jgi:CDP-diacylglycerol--glycerol-3-phosphate 3-phosphatidyltransferase